MGSKALTLYEQTRQATTVAERRELLDTFAQGDGQLDQVGHRRRGRRNCAGRLRRPRRFAADTRRGPRRSDRGGCARRAAGGCRPVCWPWRQSAGPGASPLKAALARAVAQMSGTLTMDAATTAAVGALLARSRRDRGDAADRREVGQQRRAEERGGGACRRGRTSARRRVGERRGPRRGRRRPDRAAVAGAPQTLPAIEALLDRRRHARCRSRPGSWRCSAAIPAPTSTPSSSPRAAKTRLPAVFDQIMQRPESTAARARRAWRPAASRSAQLGPGNVARLRTHPKREIGRAGRDAARRADAEGARARRGARRARAGSRKARRRRQGQGPVHRRVRDAATSSATSARTSGRRSTAWASHAASELLGHIIDPNREVDP